MVRIRFRHLLPILAALTLWLPAQAQLHRGARTIVRGGMLVQRDSLASKTDSLADLSLVRELDSLMTGLFAADSAAVAELRTDDISKADSLYRLKMAGIKIESAPTKHKRGWLMSDSMSLSKVCWISTVLPGYGQIYNKQYWKLPVLYGTLGAGLALYLHENKTYKPLKREYEAYTNKNLSRTPELDALQSRMIRSNTRRQVYLGLTVASYIYFIGDAAVNYSTNEVSDVKKATTLACIFPGAGQIYNKSYWKVPFVVGGFAAMIYCIDWNNRGYQRFKKAYRLLSDYEKNPDAYPDGPTDEFHGRYSADFIRNLRNNYRRNRDLASPIQLPYNSIVRGYINRYTDSRYGTISRILGMSQYYFPLIEDELLKEGLPIELRALPIIESALSVTAVSPMGAVGLWQFMPSTGKSYGLEVNSLVDERRDPVRSTQAACRYLKDLYAIYKDWSLAIAAYNCGPGNVNKALARAGEKSRTFWDIYDYLPRETRGYVPAFIGASYAYAYHRQHGIELTEAPIPLATDTVRIDRIMHLQQIASTIDVPIETLRQLNPQYKLDIIPATTKPYTLVLPQRSLTQYVANEPAILAKDSLYLKEYINPANLDKKRQERSGTVYTVKKGDTLGAIARRYRVTTAQLMRWNNIKSAHKLRIGQRLRIEGR